METQQHASTSLQVAPVLATTPVLLRSHSSRDCVCYQQLNPKVHPVVSLETGVCVCDLTQDHMRCHSLLNCLLSLCSQAQNTLRPVSPGQQHGSTQCRLPWLPCCSTEAQWLPSWLRVRLLQRLHLLVTPLQPMLLLLPSPPPPKEARQA